METYHIYIFDFSDPGLYHKSTDDIDRNKTEAINDDGSWNFEVLITELGFRLSDVGYIITEESLEIIDL